MVGVIDSKGDIKMNKMVNLPYSAGPLSFVKAPVIENMELLPETARVAIMGVPYDEGTTNRPGARFGPRAIREASSVYGFTPGGFLGFYDIETGQEKLSGNIIVDTGDSLVTPTQSQMTFDYISSRVSKLTDRKLFPVCLGGDHSVTFPIIRAIASTDTINVLQLDTHIDFMDDVSGAHFTHGSPMCRVSELSTVENIIQVGARGFLNSKESHDRAKKNGNIIFTSKEFRDSGPTSILQQLPTGNYYVTIDIDVFDPSIAPGTGTPEPGGLLYNEIKGFLAAFSKMRDVKVLGFDVVEVNPLFDPSGITSLLASRLILDFLGLLF